MQQPHFKTRGALARTALILLAGTTLMAQNSPQSTTPEASQLQKAKTTPLLTAELKAGLGYKDNVLESENNREGAGFALGQFDLALKPEEIPLSLRVMGEERRFVETQLLREEQAFEAEGVYSPALPERWHTTLTGLYHFDNGVEDVSDEQVGVSSAKVKGHEFTGMAELERELGDSVSVSIEPLSRARRGARFWMTTCNMARPCAPSGTLRTTQNSASAIKPETGIMTTAHKRTR